MTAALTPLRGKRATWITLLGLLLVPLTVAGLFVWGLWNPTERLEHVTAAVVNEDEPVEVDGQLVPLGRVLAGELIAGSDDDETRQNFTWVLTDAEDAREGIEDGRYATSITIPEDFSAAATSLSGGPDKVRTATITVTESDSGRLLDTALTSIVTETATRVLNQQLGEQFVGNIFVGMSSLADGISDAADGASQLADGGDQLADGTRSLADGTSELHTGTQQLANGAQALSGGVQELASGAQGLASGAAELSSGAQQAADGGQQLADNTAKYVDGVNAALSGLQTGAGAAVEPITQLRDLVAAGMIPPPEGTTAEEVVAGLNQLITQLQSASVDDPKSPITQLKQGGQQLADGAAQSAAGQQQLATGLSGLASGAQQLSDGTSALAAEVPGLASGAGELAAGVGELASGADELADGASASASGARDLADGLGEAVAQIPRYSEGERDTMAQSAIESVRAEGTNDELFNASGVPLFAGIALWAGALASFLVLSPLWARTREAAKGVFAITGRSAVPALLLGAAQGALAGIVLPIMLGYDFPKAASFLGLAVLAGVSFSLVAQGLSALLGGFGRFIAFALLVVAFTVGIVSTVPSALQAVGDASPIGAAFAGFQAVAAGASGVGAAVALLGLWGLGGLVLTAWAVVRERRPQS